MDNSQTAASIVRKKSLSFFVYIAIAAILAVLIGFGKTFFLPVAEGSFKAPQIIHIHGAFCFAWISLFLIQTLLIRNRNYSLHKRLGFLGFAIALGISITVVLVGRYVVQRDLDQGMGAAAYSSFVGIISSSLLFLVMVLLGVANRRKSTAAHKRYLLLATIIVLWPAWFRFRHYFPSIPHPEIWFAYVLPDSLILIAWAWDKMRNGFIHSSLLWAGMFIIIEQGLEVIFYDSTSWRSLAIWLFNVM